MLKTGRRETGGFVQAKRGTWFHSEPCKAVDAHMAKLAVSGLMPVQNGSEAPHVPKFAWQLIRGAAVCAPKARRRLSHHLCCSVHALHTHNCRISTLQSHIHVLQSSHVHSQTASHAFP